MDALIQAIVDFMGTLPPLLQFMAGVFATIAIAKVVLVIANSIQAKGDKKKE